jgi:cellulose synthase/poly-beta-1,6-N-acetylglucosamine synthase-like glycosyltransferase
MPTIRQLWRQRNRWQRGALEDLFRYGWTKVTRSYILRQATMGISVLSLVLYLGYMGVLFSLGTMGFSPFWAVIGCVFVAERIITVRKAGWRAMLLAAPIVPELLYDMFQHVVYVNSLVRALRGADQQW